MLVCILGGIGTAGVPAGSLPVIAMILVMVGVPPEGIGLILGVDRFLDMCRTTLNVTGDLVVAHGGVARRGADPVGLRRRLITGDCNGLSRTGAARECGCNEVGLCSVQRRVVSARIWPVNHSLHSDIRGLEWPRDLVRALV